MGQKVNPHGARVGVIRDYDTCWYSGATINEPRMEAYLAYWVILYYVKFLHLKEKMTASMRKVKKKSTIFLRNFVKHPDNFRRYAKYES